MAKKDKILTAGLNKKEEKSSLKYKPVKDTILIAISALLVFIITFSAFYLTPQSTSTHVEIRYLDKLLWDKNDSEKKTTISFPDKGSITLQFLKEEGPIYLGEGNYFNFYGDEVDVTIYSDKSIQITKEESPRNICSNLGRVYSTYSPLICLPNNIQASIVSNMGFPEYDN